jgi:hypothetical protein
MILSEWLISLIFLLILAIISPAKAQTATCGPTSPQCCTVVRIWQLMGKTTSVSSTSATACCSMSGVTCTSDGTVTQISWNRQGLTGSIPPEIGNLTSLTIL